MQRRQPSHPACAPHRECVTLLYEFAVFLTAPAYTDDLVGTQGDPYNAPAPANHIACVPRRRPGVWRFLSKSAVRSTVPAYTNDRLELTKVYCQFRDSALSQRSLCSTPLRARLHLLVAMSFREPLQYLTTLSEHQVALTKHWPGRATTPAKPSCLLAAQSTRSVLPCCATLLPLQQLQQTLTTLSAYQVVLTTPLYPPSHPACALRSRPRGIALSVQICCPSDRSRIH